MMNAFYVVVNEISLGTDSLVFGLFHDLSGVNVTAIVHEKAPFEQIGRASCRERV